MFFISMKYHQVYVFCGRFIVSLKQYGLLQRQGTPLEYWWNRIIINIKRHFEIRIFRYFRPEVQLRNTWKRHRSDYLPQGSEIMSKRTNWHALKAKYLFQNIDRLIMKSLIYILITFILSILGHPIVVSLWILFQDYLNYKNV